MFLAKKYAGYDIEDDGKEIVPSRARPARVTYVWYHHGHCPYMRELSRKQGSPYRCGMHPDGRCTKGWEREEAGAGVHK